VRRRVPEFTPNTIVQFFDALLDGAGSVAAEAVGWCFLSKTSLIQPSIQFQFESKTIAEQLNLRCKMTS